MLVGCSPPKWRFLKYHEDSRAARVKRTKVSVIDYDHEGSVTQTCHQSTSALQEALSGPGNGSDVRLLVVEDLSRDVVELLGSHFDIDPLFFLSHIGDYLFHNTKDRWAELPDLEVDARRRTHFNLQYLRPRFFEDEAAFEEAERISGTFNVLRRLDSDRSRKSLQNGILDRPGPSVTLSRAKTSLWIRPRKPEDPVLGILLVDPTVSRGSSLWGGYRPFDNTPSMKEVAQLEKEGKSIGAPPGTTLFDDVVYWSCRLSKEDLTYVKQDPKYLAAPMYKLMLADWLNTLKYMTTMFGLLEWGFEKPHWSEDPSDIDKLLKKLSPWRRNVGYYQTMINDAIARLFPQIAASYPSPPTNPPSPAQGLHQLRSDFQNVKHLVDEHKARIGSIQTMATNAINTEEARRAVKQNKNLTRLTVLATTFIPLNFTSSFLSISSDFPQAKTSIWLFFVLGIPITLLAFMIVDLTHPDRSKSFCKKLWHRVFGKKKKNTDEEYLQQQQQQNSRPPSPERKETSAWPYYRENSQMRKWITHRG